MGKTTTLETVRRATGDAFTSVAIRGEAMETGIAFGLLEQLSHLLRRGDPRREREPPLERPAPYLETLELLRRHEGPPLLITVDDLHWADLDSLAAFAFIARRLANLPVLLLAALRPWPREASTAAVALEAQGNARISHLAALSRAAGDELLIRSAGRPVDRVEAERAWEHCRGNPLLTAHVGVALGRGDDPFGDAPRPGAVPAHHLLITLFAGLDEDTVGLARCASVMGASFRPEVVVDVAGVAPRAADQALEALQRAGLVTEQPDGWLRFVHPLVGHTLYDDIVAPVRSRLHRRAFEELDRRGLSLEAAEHAMRADLAGDARAAELLEEVGRESIRRGGLRSGTRHLETALRFRGDRASTELIMTVAQAECASGQAARAAELCHRMLAHPQASWQVQVQARALLGRCRYLQGEPGHGVHDLEQAVLLAEAHDPGAAVMPLLEHSVSLWMAAGPRQALPLAARARRLARRAAPHLREIADARWGSLAAESGDVDALKLVLLQSRWAHHVPIEDLPTAELVSPLASIYPYAHCAQYGDRLDECVAALELARRKLDEVGAMHASAVTSGFLANHLVRRGRLDEALASADRAGTFSEFTPLMIPVAGALRAVTITWMGRVDEGRREADRALAAAPNAWLVQLWAALAHGLGRLSMGDPEAAAVFLRVERILDEAGIREPNHTQWAGHGVAAHLLANRVDHAERITRGLERVAPGHPSRWPRFAASLARGRINEHLGATDAALEGYRTALAQLGDLDLPLQRAEALLAGGSLLRRCARAVDARPWLADAQRLADRHGARALAVAAETELRLAGGRRRRVRDRDALTPAESRVARAAAGGLTNAEIAASLHLSVNTVTTHLRHVYAKLGIASRRRLAGLLLEDPF